MNIFHYVFFFCIISFNKTVDKLYSKKNDYMTGTKHFSRASRLPCFSSNSVFLVFFLLNSYIVFFYNDPVCHLICKVLQRLSSQKSCKVWKYFAILFQLIYYLFITLYFYFNFHTSGLQHGIFKWKRRRGECYLLEINNIFTHSSYPTTTFKVHFCFQKGVRTQNPYCAKFVLSLRYEIIAVMQVNQ